MFFDHSLKQSDAHLHCMVAYLVSILYFLL